MSRALSLSPVPGKPDDWLLLALLGGAALWWFTRDGVALSAGEAAGAAVSDAGAGVVIGIGDTIGVPHTDKSACQAAIDEGRTWDASFACPALDFINYLRS